MINDNTGNIPNSVNTTPVTSKALYSARGREIAQKAVDTFSKSNEGVILPWKRVSSSKKESVQNKALQTISQDPETSSLEKLLADLGNSFDGTVLEKCNNLYLKNVLNQTIAAQIPGPLGFVLGDFNVKVFNAKILKPGETRAIHMKTFREISRSPLFSKREKEIAELGLAVSGILGDTAAMNTSSLVMYALRTPPQDSTANQLAKICRSVCTHPDIPPRASVAFVGEGLNMIRQHPSADPWEAALAEFAYEMTPHEIGEELSASLRGLVVDKITKKTRSNIDEEIADTMRLYSTYRRFQQNPSKITEKANKPYKIAFEQINKNKSTLPDNRILAGISEEIFRSNLGHQKVRIGSAMLLEEIAKPSSDNFFDRLTTLGNKTKEAEGGYNPETTRVMLTSAFSALLNNSWPDNMKILVMEGAELGKPTSPFYKDTKKSVEKQMNVLKLLAEITRKKDVPPVEIQKSEESMSIDGVTLTKRKKKFRLL